jgi:hypothetical protein
MTGVSNKDSILGPSISNKYFIDKAFADKIDIYRGL